MLAVVALALWAVAAHGRVAPRWAVWLALGGLVLAAGLAAGRWQTGCFPETVIQVI